MGVLSCPHDATTLFQYSEVNLSPNHLLLQSLHHASYSTELSDPSESIYFGIRDCRQMNFWHSLNLFPSRTAAVNRDAEEEEERRSEGVEVHERSRRVDDVPLWFRVSGLGHRGVPRGYEPQPVGAGNVSTVMETPLDRSVGGRGGEVTTRRRQS